MLSSQMSERLLTAFTENTKALAGLTNAISELRDRNICPYANRDRE